MKNKFCNPPYYFIFFIAILLSFPSCKNNSGQHNVTGYTVKDDLNVEVKFDSIPQRIITLAPNLTEIVYSLNLQDKLIGNTTFCNYPDDAKNKTKVGDLLSIDFERILNLKPDLIIITVEGNVRENYEKLKQLGFKTFVSNPRDYAGIKKTITDISRIFQVQETAKEIIAGWDKRYNAVKKVIENREPESAIFFVGFNPIMAAGKNTFINELVVTAGLKNITSDSPLNYPVFSREQILKRNPDYILATKDMLQNTGELIKMYPEWKSLKAIRENRVIAVDPDMYLRPGPRFIPALEDLVSKIYKSGISGF